jgi:DNA-binding transcriptional MerR regulator
MYVSELAAYADVPVATVKYYLRAGLLPPGEVVGPRRAVYDQTHLRRLKILRMLREVGGIPVATLQQVMDAVDDAERRPHEVLCLVADALTDTAPDLTPDPASQAMVDTALDEVGWSGVRADAVARRQLAALVRLLTAEGPLSIGHDTLAFYVRLTDALCRAEIDFIEDSDSRAGTLEDMLAGEAVFGQVLALLRRMGHEHYHAVGHHVAVDETEVVVAVDEPPAVSAT